MGRKNYSSDFTDHNTSGTTLTDVSKPSHRKSRNNKNCNRCRRNPCKCDSSSTSSTKISYSKCKPSRKSSSCSSSSSSKSCSKPCSKSSSKSCSKSCSKSSDSDSCSKSSDSCDTTSMSGFSTICDAIHMIEADSSCSSSNKNSCIPDCCDTSRSDYNCKPKRCNDQYFASQFNSIITPLNNLKPDYGNQSCVRFNMRRKNKVVTLQWEPFTGILAANGVPYLEVCQSICNTPQYPVSFALPMKYKNDEITTRTEINPYGSNTNIKFYLPSGTQGGDSIKIYGGCISWIVE